jgi:hypothetical protein
MADTIESDAFETAVESNLGIDVEVEGVTTSVQYASTEDNNNNNDDDDALGLSMASGDVIFIAVGFFLVIVAIIVGVVYVTKSKPSRGVITEEPVPGTMEMTGGMPQQSQVVQVRGVPMQQPSHTAQVVLMPQQQQQQQQHSRVVSIDPFDTPKRMDL